MRLPLGRLNQMTILQMRDAFVAARTSLDDVSNPAKELADDVFKFVCGTFTLLLQLVPALKELTSYGTRSFHQCLLRVEVRRRGWWRLNVPLVC